MPEFFVWDRKKKAWYIRERGEAIGRIHYIGPSAGDLYYIRLLLLHTKGPTSFEDLRTHDGVLLEWKEKCVALGLAHDDRSIDETLEEAITFQTGYALRHLFVQILLFLEPVDPLRLWNKYKKE